MQTFKLQISLKRTLITIFRRELIWFYVMPSSICHWQFTLIILKTCKISKKKKCSIFRIYMAFIIKKDNAPWILLYWFKVLQSRQYFDDLHLMLHKKNPCIWDCDARFETCIIYFIRKYYYIDSKFCNQDDILELYPIDFQYSIISIQAIAWLLCSCYK